MALLNLQEISLAFGGPPLLDGISLQIQEGEKICLLGRNGSGKTSLMRVIGGDLQPDSGKIICGSHMKAALLTQEVPVDMMGTIYSVIEGGIDSLHDSDARSEQNHRSMIEKTLSLLTLDEGLEFNTLSAGMKRRVLLGRALVCEPDILLLDEPTNHLDIDTIKWLENFLQRYDKTVFFVTHDRSFLQKTANRIIELDRGKIYDWSCDYRTFLQRKEAWLDAEEAQQAVFDRKLAREEAWIRKGIKARRTRNEGRVRALENMRRERAGRRELSGNVKMEIQLSRRSGKLVIEAEGISFGYGDDNIIENFSTTILRGDRVGLVGPNGCGKSTLIKILLEELEPNKGAIKKGTNINHIYFDQLRGQLDDAKSVRENMAETGDMIDFNGRSRHVIGYLQDFLFSPERVDARVEVLSGGEKNRLMLAKLFASPANLIILDEPTNDLDLETVELLEEMLMEYQGTLLLVSHDREFLNNVVTSTLFFEGNGTVTTNVGGYDELEARKTEKPVKKTEKKVYEKKKPESKKLSFKEKRELESLPLLLDEKEARRKEIFSLMARPALYQENPQMVSELKEELELLEDELESLYSRWDELEERNSSDPVKR